MEKNNGEGWKGMPSQIWRDVYARLRSLDLTQLFLNFFTVLFTKFKISHHLLTFKSTDFFFWLISMVSEALSGKTRSLEQESSGRKLLHLTVWQLMLNPYLGCWPEHLHVGSPHGLRLELPHSMAAELYRQHSKRGEQSMWHIYNGTSKCPWLYATGFQRGGANITFGKYNLL